MPEEVSGTSDPEVDLTDDAVGRSRHERFYSVRSPIMREPVEWGAFEGTFAYESEATNSRTHFTEYLEVRNS